MFTKANAEAYFNAEKSASLIFIVIGAAAVLLAILSFFAVKTSFYKGVALPLLLIGIVQMVAGYSVYSRSDKQRQDIVYKMDLDPDGLQQKEIPRMQKVMENFKVFRYVEILLVVAGAGMFYYFGTGQRGAHTGAEHTYSFWAGVGLALAIQAAICMVGDGLAEKRGKEYVSGLQGFVRPKR